MHKPVLFLISESISEFKFLLIGEVEKQLQLLFFWTLKEKMSSLQSSGKWQLQSQSSFLEKYELDFIIGGGDKQFLIFY
jgi:hypothetical protein